MMQISNVVEKVISPILRDNRLYLAQIIFNWEKIVGEDTSSYTFPYKIQHSKKQQVLLVKFSNSSFGAELYYQKEHMISKISFFFGKKIVDDIQFVMSLSCFDGKDQNEVSRYVLKGNRDYIYNKHLFSSIKDLDLQRNLSKLSYYIKVNNKD